MKMSSRSQKVKAMERSYDGLRKELGKSGYLWEGTVLRRFVSCGKKACGCRKGTGHGPYYYWTRKAKGKTVTRMLSDDEGKLFMSWSKNRQDVKKTLKRMAKENSQQN